MKPILTNTKEASQHLVQRNANTHITQFNNYPCLLKSYNFSLSLSHFQICHQIVTCNLHKIVYLPLEGHNDVTTELWDY